MSDKSNLLKFRAVDCERDPEKIDIDLLLDNLKLGHTDAFDDHFMLNGCIAAVLVDECLLVHIVPDEEFVTAYKSPIETVKQYRALNSLAIMRDGINARMRELGLPDIW